MMNGMPTPTPLRLSHRFCVAPMVDRTDRHYRYLLRLLSRRAVLYTEMTTTQALRRGDRQRLLEHDPAEAPLALQVAGNEPAELGWAAHRAHESGYDEVNLNAGCPSERIATSAGGGACLMREPQRSADCIAAMAEADLSVSLKCRIGVDGSEDYDALAAYVGGALAAGADTIIVHARSAWLNGLSPRGNRRVPPLRHELVYRLKRDFQQAEIVLNGGLDTLASCHASLRQVDGVMLGRAVWRNPWLLASVDPLLFNAPPPAASRQAALAAFLPYAEEQLRAGTRTGKLLRALWGLCHGIAGARRWRQRLATADRAEITWRSVEKWRGWLPDEATADSSEIEDVALFGGASR